MSRLYIFVEGSDDERFFMHFCANFDIRIIQYSGMKNKELSGYIKTISKDLCSDYIIVCDSDGSDIEHKKNNFVQKHPDCNIDKIIVAKREIESWYLAGYNRDNCEKKKIKYIFNTDDISKEQFRHMIPKNYSIISFQMEILSVYDVILAKQRNRSFCIFYDYQKEMSLDCFSDC